ncbi:hypothetical protein N7456_010260 [Penicillium angulare]|uniref:Uncharacterized protein n=1 Tax=Penicillium angulare TaxID=116970 RepID=A0A9W9F6G3_9EURO|nr:hypothetical protein N7456_010260 [Penicillium angulare]
MATNTVQKAISDTENEPSIWWVDFPDKQSVEKQDLLAITMNKVNEYRNWASLQWWQTVFGNDQRVPQDSSAPSATIRSSFCAEVASVHMKQTPWYE